MGELRWNPLLKTWVMVAPNRQERPNMPKDWCPFCPGSGKVPDHYDVLKYDNDFPVLKMQPDEPEVVGNDFYRVMPNYGKCEVILYSSDHNAKLWQLSIEHIIKLVNLWIERNNELSNDKKIKYVFPFENRGEEVGVTITHPHGQIYAYPYVPLKLKAELESCKEYYEEHKECMICRMNKEEIAFEKRVVFENAGFIAYLPFFTDYPYGVFIVSKRHFGNLSELAEEEKKDLAAMLKTITGAFDVLFERPFPYMMVIHQTPVNAEEYKESKTFFHFHIEFYPPLRDKDKIKWYASSEMGAWACANPLSVEETAQKKRYAIKEFERKWT
ncbi:MAG: galactose-1-phosphate uridylyltransferase [Caldisericaceae bacterium]